MIVNLYLFTLMLVYSVLLIRLHSINQHLLLWLFAYVNFIVATRKLALKNILKIIMYSLPSVAGFAASAFIFAADGSMFVKPVANAVYLSLHYFLIIFISCLYSTSIDFCNLAIYLYNLRLIPFFLAYNIFMLDLTMKLVLQHWQKMWLVYRIRQYKWYSCYKLILSLILYALEHSRELAIANLTRSLVNQHAPKIVFRDSKISWATLRWWHYILFFLPFMSLIIN